MGRTMSIWWIIASFGCYSPTPHENLPCSETAHCPVGQSCDQAFHVCASFPPCEMPEISDSFELGLDPCTPWGLKFGNAAVDETNGALRITPQTTGLNSGGCDSNSDLAFGQGGAFVEVGAVLTSPRGFTALSLTTTGGAVIGAGNGLLSLGPYPGTADVATIAYDPTEMRWWRLRPDRASDTIIGEYSADGSHWTLLGAVGAVPVPDRVIPELSALVEVADPNPGTAVFESFDVCPTR